MYFNVWSQVVVLLGTFRGCGLAGGSIPVQALRVWRIWALLHCAFCFILAVQDMSSQHWMAATYRHDGPLSLGDCKAKQTPSSYKLALASVLYLSSKKVMSTHTFSFITRGLGRKGPYLTTRGFKNVPRSLPDITAPPGVSLDASSFLLGGQLSSTVSYWKSRLKETIIHYFHHGGILMSCICPW